MVRVVAVGAALQKAPYDFVIEDDTLDAAGAAQARHDATVWTDVGAYPLLPYSCIVLESFTEEQLLQQVRRTASS